MKSERKNTKQNEPPQEMKSRNLKKKSRTEQRKTKRAALSKTERNINTTIAILVNK